MILCPEHPQGKEVVQHLLNSRMVCLELLPGGADQDLPQDSEMGLGHPQGRVCLDPHLE